MVEKRRLLVIPILVLLVLSRSSSVLGTRLDKLAVPSHYDVQLTIDVETKTFFVDETIEFTLLEDSNEISLNVYNLEGGGWLSNTILRPIDQDVEYQPLVSETHISGVQQSVVLTFALILPGNTNYTLQLTNVRGSFGSGLVEVPLTNPAKYLLTTGFDNTNLRSLIPCFDEPEYRATFDFTVFHTTGYSLLHNFAEISIVGPIVENNNFMRIEYKSSLPLSPSSIVFVLTDLEVEKTSNNRVGLYSLQAKDSYPVYLLLNELFSPLLLSIEAELNSVLSNPKLDIIHVPNLRQRSITKYGFVFVDDSFFNIENAEDFAEAKKDISANAATAVMQVYFGELVSQEWWTDWWVLKGLARYLSGLRSDNWRFIFDTVQKAFRHGADGTSLSSPYSTIGAINNANLAVIDRKAATLMRMIANIIGEENFREAAVQFLSIYEHLAINSAEFFSHLEGYTSQAILPPSTTLTTVLSAWESLLDYPILSVARRDENTVLIAQLHPGERVDIPVDYYTSSSLANMRPKLWLSPSEETAAIETTDSWIFVNPLQMGLYRVRYEDTLWAGLLAQLTANHLSFSSLDRAQLIGDSAGLAISGDSPFQRYFEVIHYLAKETDTFTWKSVGSIYEDLSMRFGNLEERPRFLYYHNSLANATYLANRITSSDYQKTLQVGRLACFAGNSQCISDAERHLNATLESGRALTGPEEFQYMIYCTLAKYLEDTSSLVNGLIRALVDDDNIDSALVAIRGLGCSTDATLLQTLYTYAGSRQLEIIGIFFTSAQRTIMFRSLLHGDYNATKQGLQYILDNYITLSSLIPDMGNLFSAISDKIYSLELQILLEDILSTHTIRMTPSVQVLVRQQVMLSSSNVNWLTSKRTEVNQWLKDNVELPGGASALKAFNSLLVLVSAVLVKYFL